MTVPVPGVNQRTPVEAKWGLRTDDIENRREDVHRFGKPVHDLAAPLSGHFHDQRHLNDVREIVLPRSRLPSGAALTVTGTMIGGDDDERLVVHPDVAEPADHVADETIGKPDLRQMPLVERIGVSRAHSLEQLLSRYIVVW